jgi:plasmid stability protein
MTHHKRVEFRIRNLDSDIHHLLKIRAAIEKKTMNQVIIEALTAHVKPLTRIRPILARSETGGTVNTRGR